MPKHSRDENAAASDEAHDSSSAKAMKSTSACEYCDKKFTTRGMSLHQKKCVKKQAHDKAAAKKTRFYKFSILNGAVHEEILSFLSNQTLTKMQMITGDRYQQCEPELARYCCKCENDNPSIDGFCRLCDSERKWGYRAIQIEKQVAKDNYGMREKDFSDMLGRGESYDREKLENYMIKSYGSKMGWLRYLAKRNKRKTKAQATRKRNEEETDAFLKSLAPGFAPYVWSIGFKKTDQELLRQSSQRFVALKSKLDERGLHLPASSTLCSDFITAGVGNIDDVVRDTGSVVSRN
ncbi:hypothetical protein PC129_g17790 [Phytophthora cactorum]|uniref:Uncharacterized protein n=1 Tax=Phytophthora cactorum TaxID=29920 RepID=A0A329T364_9STRA|nr:hypothetical protein Pcac1_g11406 [Phytophthora cactorum]KAG2805765.1 hypothetical protein PC112_g18135 [Phytophthora cactorum]KAG2807153.1 hypothetical protein PC111_g17054 [Phytophthora cactorum]KAG2846163.1 hypothetical protein PC113_g18038 [Phytophthora cactorum]KAG2883464.1 hypothetical protein PC114_g20575 [Phytophthora cactorum]